MPEKRAVSERQGKPTCRHGEATDQNHLEDWMFIEMLLLGLVVFVCMFALTYLCDKI